MNFIFGLIIFWLSIIGLLLFFKDKIKINYYFVLPITFSLIGIAIFFAGLLNIMNIVSSFICIFGIGYLVYYMKINSFSCEKIFKILKKPSIIILIFVFLYITFLSLNMKLTHYDNFSHWGLIVKTMFHKSSLPNFEDAFILFKGYQPGSACFIYYLGLLAGKTESVMIIAQNYLIFSFLIPLLYFIEKDNKLIKKILLVVLYIFILTTSIKFNDLLVDSLLGTMFLCSILIIYYFKNDLKQAFLCSFPVIIYMFLVKNVGLVFAGMCILYLIYISYKNNKLKKGIIYSFELLVVLGLILLIWQAHVKMVYGGLSVESKHSLTPGNILVSITSKGIKNIILFLKTYFTYMFNFKQNIALLYIFIINIYIILYVYIKEKKCNISNFLNKLLIINGIYIFYYIVLGIMYIFSMPLDEALVLAGIDRYLMTIITFIIGLCLVYVFENPLKNNKINGMVSLIIILTLIVPIFYNKENANVLIGNNDYKNSIVEKVDTILDSTIVSDKTNYYVYAPSAVNDGGYLNYVFKYKLLSNEVFIISSYNDIEKINNGILIIFDEDESIYKLLNNSARQISNSVYKIGN